MVADPAGPYGASMACSDASRIDTSTCSPSPVCRAAHSASSVAHAACVQAVWLASCPGGISGGWPGRPDRDSSLFSAIWTQSVAAQSRYGPVWPNALIDVTTRPGLTPCSSPGPHPAAASVPGAWSSIRMSAPAASSSSRSRPAGVRQSMVSLRLFALVTAKRSPRPPAAGSACRAGSPPVGSASRTSAPRSASRRPHSWPGPLGQVQHARRRPAAAGGPSGCLRAGSSRRPPSWIQGPA